MIPMGLGISLLQPLAMQTPWCLMQTLKQALMTRSLARVTAMHLKSRLNLMASLVSP